MNKNAGCSDGFFSGSTSGIYLGKYIVNSWGNDGNVNLLVDNSGGNIPEKKQYSVYRVSEYKDYIEYRDAIYRNLSSQELLQSRT